jgi:hypothetical protein
MELRYVKNGEHWMPQKKSKSGTWEDFSEDWTKKHTSIYKLAIAIADLENKNPFYSNTKTMFFVSEMHVMAFLGGCQSYFSQEAKAFEIFIDKS